MNRSLAFGAELLVAIILFSTQNHVEADSFATYPGTVRALADVNLVAEIDGKIASQSLAAGDIIKKGETVVKVDSQDAKLALDESLAKLEMYSSDYQLTVSRYDRSKSLRTKLNISVDQLEESRANMAAAYARLSAAKIDVATARRNLAKYDIQAPFEGILVEDTESLGQYITAGTVVARLVKTSSYFIDVLIHPSVAAQSPLVATIDRDNSPPVEGQCSIEHYSSSPVVSKDTGMRRITFSVKDCKLLVSQVVALTLTTQGRNSGL